MIVLRIESRDPEGLMSQIDANEEEFKALLDKYGHLVDGFTVAWDGEGNSQVSTPAALAFLRARAGGADV